MAGYPYYNNFLNYSAYQPQIMNPFPNGNSSPVQQTQTVIRVPSYDVVKTFPVDAGKPLTFFDDNIPFVYAKTSGASPVDPPKTRIFELVERTEEYLSQYGTKNGDFPNVSENSIDTSDFVKKSEFDDFRRSFDTIIQSVDKLRFDVDALGEKSTKKMVQKARKDADDE